MPHPRRPLALAALVAVVIVASCGAKSEVHTTRADPIGSAPLTRAGSPATTGPQTTGPTDSTGTTGTTGPSQSTLDWGKCTDPNATDAALQCATLKVPLDYDNPTG